MPDREVRVCGKLIGRFVWYKYFNKCHQGRAGLLIDINHFFILSKPFAGGHFRR